MLMYWVYLFIDISYIYSKEESVFSVLGMDFFIKIVNRNYFNSYV